MSAGGDDERLQQMAAQMQELEGIIEALQAQVQRMRTEQVDIRAAIEAIGSLEDGDAVQVPLGGGAYVRAAIEDMDEVIVGLGAGYAAEREEAEAVDLLETQADRLDERIDEARAAIADLEAQGEELSAQAQQEYAELAARQQGAGGGGVPGPNLGGDE